jgi:ABC-2 type transport system ATP-binding protein
MSRPSLKISVDNLNVNYGSVLALSIDNLEVSGNVIALVGHNGSGKSTFLKSLLGLIAPQRGTLSASIEELSLTPENHMAFSPETGAIFSDISVEDYLKLWCRLKRKSPSYYLEEGREVLKSLSITELLGKLGRELSKGQKRRVQIAVCLLIGSKLQVFDEPFDGLDIQQAATLADTVSAYLGSSSLLISSHRMDIVERLADSIIMLEQGKVIASGPVSEIPKKLGCRGFTVGTKQAPTANRQIANQLNQRFPKAVVHQIGTQLNLVGTNLTTEKIELTFQSLGLQGYIVEELNPSLADVVHVRQKSFG